MDIQILKIANDPNYDSTGKFIGTHVSDQLNDKLNLLSFAEGVSKSLLLRQIISAYLDPLDLVAAVAERVHSLYLMKGQPWSHLSLKLYKDYTAHELVKRGIGSELVDAIFQEFDRLLK